jgi:hypothetical protein
VSQKLAAGLVVGFVAATLLVLGITFTFQKEHAARKACWDRGGIAVRNLGTVGEIRCAAPLEAR